MAEGLEVSVLDGMQVSFNQVFHGPVELGRQRDGKESLYTVHRDGEHDRLIIARLEEGTVSRNHALIEPLSNQRVRVTSLGSRTTIRLEDGSNLGPGVSQDLPLPALLLLGVKRVRLRAPLSKGLAEPLDDLRRLQQPTLRPGGTASPELSALSLGETSRSISAFFNRADMDDGMVHQVVDWMTSTAQFLQTAIDSPDLFHKAAEALVQIVGLDRGSVLLLEDGRWRMVASLSAPHADQIAPRPSQHMLARILGEKRTFWQVPTDLLGASESLLGIESVIASPILNSKGDVIGALYGDCGMHRLIRGGRITRVEAMVVELLARGVATALARMELEQETLARRLQALLESGRDTRWVMHHLPALLKGRDPLKLARGQPAQKGSEQTDPRRLGEFELQSILGQGGMAVVYRARHLPTEREVALKAPLQTSTPQAQTRFEREIEALSRVRHPNLIRLLSAGKEGWRRYFAMELVEGTTLDVLRTVLAGEDFAGLMPPPDAFPHALQQASEKTWRGEQPLPALEKPLHRVRSPQPQPVLRQQTYARQVVSLLLGIVDAVHCLHEAGIIHRDLKPHNILITADGSRAVLIDLGLVKDAEGPSTLTRTGQFVGTPRYASPEQVRGSASLDRRSDIYTLGVTMWEQLTLKPMYSTAQSDSSAHATTATPPSEELLQQILEAEPRPIRTFQPAIPAKLDAIVLRCLRKRPAERYTTAVELAKDLRDFLATDSVEAQARALSPAFSSHTVITRYPAPIALAYRRFCRQREPTARLKMLFTALEATLRYLVTLAVCDLLQEKARDGHGTDLFPPHEAFDFLRRQRPISLGSRAETLCETARLLARVTSPFLPELAKVCAPRGVFMKEVIPRLVQMRNATAHEEGGVAVTSEECQELLREARPLLEGAFQQIQFVCDYPLGFVQKSRGSRPGADSHRYYFHSCMGAHIANTVEAAAVEIPTPLQEHVAFVVSRDGTRLLYLWPLLFERVAAHTQRHSLYVFEEIPDRHGAFLTRVRCAAIDFRDSWTDVLRAEPAGSHAWLADRLRALPSVAEVPSQRRLHEQLASPSGGKLVGQVLGPNRLLAVVATGGFSTVYAAEHTSTQQRVAVKVLESPEAQRHLARFRQEFEKLQQAGQHPHIIRCLDWGNPILANREYPWFSMEFALGGDLSGRIEDRRADHPGVVPWQDAQLRTEIVREFRAIVSAVSHLHSLGIVHRDIKPGNVLIMDDSELRLTDFGLVKDLSPGVVESRLEAAPVPSPHTSTGAVLGTRHYMAPEQERGQAVEKPADTYALGILLAELATGIRPHADTSVLSGSTLRRCPAVSQLSAPLRDFIGRCTDVEAAQRPANAALLLEAFEQLLTSPSA